MRHWTIGINKRVATVADRHVVGYITSGNTLRIAQRINAACRENGISYSDFMGKIHEAGLELNRKVLADLAMNHPKAFTAVVKKVVK